MLILTRPDSSSWSRSSRRMGLLPTVDLWVGSEFRFGLSGEDLTWRLIRSSGCLFFVVATPLVSAISTSSGKFWSSLWFIFRSSKIWHYYILSGKLLRATISTTIVNDMENKELDTDSLGHLNKSPLFRADPSLKHSKYWDECLSSRIRFTFAQLHSSLI